MSNQEGFIADITN